GFVQATEGYLRKLVAGTQIALFEHPSDMALSLRKPASQAHWGRHIRAIPPVGPPRQWAEPSQVATIE
ncbi:MAG TPA: hypothetical protein VN673_00285, partial [Clostridia bacterium]|nr:hypothetical protein [Clostridia bacterium]